MITLKPCWQDTMATHAFAIKSGVIKNTLRRWIQQVPDHVVRYIALCTILDISPQELLDGDVETFCSQKGITFPDVCYLCGELNVLAFRHELEGSPKPKALLILAQLYSCYGSFEPLFGIDLIKESISKRIQRVSALLCAA